MLPAADGYRWLRLAAVAVVMAGVVAASHAGTGAPVEDRPNVLFIAIDDLRPELGCYGAEHIRSPHIDRLASQGVVFKRAYCQAPVCGPSRSSLLAGVYPRDERRQAWSLDAMWPGAITLPQAFRQAGYHTIGNGKVFHRSEQAAERSWSEPAFSHVNGPPDNNHMTMHDPASSNYIGGRKNRGPFFEAADVADSAYIDGQTCDKTLADLRRLAAMDKPFFLACGFVRPHLPFYAPRKYWDRYERDRIDLADNRFKPRNAPAALRGSREVHSYHDRDLEYNSPEFHRAARHGYYACVSYVDALVGKLLAGLDELGLRDNTIVVLWGDHGWHLGEHNYWSKHNLLHLSTRAPLIISAPGGLRDVETQAIVGLIDLYPTLCELAGVQPPETLEGTSLAPLLNDTRRAGYDFEYIRHDRGHTVVTRDYTYTEWHNGQDGRMLFDLRTDPGENLNVAELPAYEQTVERLSASLARHAAKLRRSPAPQANGE